MGNWALFREFGANRLWVQNYRTLLQRTRLGQLERSAVMRYQDCTRGMVLEGWFQGSTHTLPLSLLLYPESLSRNGLCKTTISY